MFYVLEIESFLKNMFDMFLTSFLYFILSDHFHLISRIIF